MDCILFIGQEFELAEVQHMLIHKVRTLNARYAADLLQNPRSAIGG